MPIAADLYYHLYAGGEEGERPPIVLIHGAGGTHLFWPPEVRRLPGYRVFALDLPGHGKSEGRGQQTVSAYMEAVLDWLQALGIHRAVFVGHSMGSAIALSLAIHHSDQALGLGLLGASAWLRVNPLLLESTSNETTFHQAVETIASWSFSPQAPEQLTELAARRLAETRPSVLHADFLACNDFDVTQEVAELHQPTIVICGAEDQMTPLRQAQFLASTIPGARLVTIENAGHMVMLEQPQSVAQALLEFLSGINYL
jgi:pimeloyl-ACP methyl ester carboxylesterase